MYTKPVDANVRRRYNTKTWEYRKAKSLFGPVTKLSDAGIIHEYREKLSDARSMSVPLVGKITRRGFGMKTDLEGNEFALANGATDVFPAWMREAIVVHVVDAHESVFDLYAARRPALDEWLVNMDNTRAIEAFLSVANDTQKWLNDADRITPRTVTFYDANDTQRSDYLSANEGRVLFGGDADNLVGGDWDASMSGLPAGEKMGAAVLREAVAMAEQTDWENGVYPIHPYMDGEQNEEMYMVYHDTASFTNLMLDNEVMEHHKAMIQTHLPGTSGQKHPYIRGGDVIYGRTINRRMASMDPYLRARLTANTFGTNPDACGAVLAGRQSLIKGVGRPAVPTRRSTMDYDTKKGVGTMCLDTYEKVFFQRDEANPVGPGQQFSTINIFTAR